MNSDIQSKNSLAQFDQLWRAQETQFGRMTLLQQVAISDIQTDTAGVVSAIAAYTVSLISPSGAVTTRTYDVSFVQQAGGWRLWYTTPR